MRSLICMSQIEIININLVLKGYSILYTQTSSATVDVYITKKVCDQWHVVPVLLFLSHSVITLNQYNAYTSGLSKSCFLRSCLLHSIRCSSLCMDVKYHIAQRESYTNTINCQNT